MASQNTFEPTRQAALARLDAVDPDAYARSRNYLHGAVTRLSPYLTHGLLSLQEVYNSVHARHPLDAAHKLVFELGWRAYYRHVWSHLGDAIHQSLHAGVLPEQAYQTAMPDDVLCARTGVPVIDLSVRTLYETGYLHNHARMWLASYLVHVRKVHWHAGAQWMLAYLLDGDVASNHLSWQWVAGTGSNKPYLFNAENVAKYAPAPWHSPGSVLDTSYEALGIMAQSPGASAHSLGLGGLDFDDAGPTLATAPNDPSWTVPSTNVFIGRDVWLLHPWSLGAGPDAQEAGCAVIGVGFVESHADAAWSERRWKFVTEGLRARTQHLWWGSVEEVALALSGARSVQWQPEPHVDAAFAALQSRLARTPNVPALHPRPQTPLFTPVARYCNSFSKWWKQTRLTT